MVIWSDRIVKHKHLNGDTSERMHQLPSYFRVKLRVLNKVEPLMKYDKILEFKIT